jgi:hypothetical protein
VAKAKRRQEEGKKHRRNGKLKVKKFKSELKMSREQLGVETTTAVRELSVIKQLEMRAPRLQEISTTARQG